VLLYVFIYVLCTLRMQTHNRYATPFLQSSSIGGLLAYLYLYTERIKPAYFYGLPAVWVFFCE
jgi:hypothetical protein